MRQSRPMGRYTDSVAPMLRAKSNGAVRVRVLRGLSIFFVRVSCQIMLCSCYLAPFVPPAGHKNPPGMAVFCRFCWSRRRALNPRPHPWQGCDPVAICFNREARALRTTSKTLLTSARFGFRIGRLHRLGCQPRVKDVLISPHFSRIVLHSELAKARMPITEIPYFLRLSMAHPARFELTTSAFGGQRSS